MDSYLSRKLKIKAEDDEEGQTEFICITHKMRICL